MTNIKKAIELAKKYATKWCDEECEDISSEQDCFDTAKEMAEFKDAQPISKLGGWDAEPPTADCRVLLETKSKHEPYVVAGWSSHDKCFYDSNEQKYTKWIRWKRI